MGTPRLSDSPTDSLSLTQECPSGVVNEETFKQIYAQFFPHGGEFGLKKTPPGSLSSPSGMLPSSSSTGPCYLPPPQGWGDLGAAFLPSCKMWNPLKL